MKADTTILVLGAGRSSSSLINYLLDQSEVEGWKIRIADASLSFAQQKAGSHPRAEALQFDVHNEPQRKEEIRNADLVISLMPPPFHFLVAQTCLEYSKHLLTASYVSPEIESLNEAASRKGILILMESGLDPGIDHMSAIKELDEIKKKGGALTSFKSFTGGLVAPESDNNPWHYKITWNPRNVVLAGQGTSKYLSEGKIKELSYEELFARLDKISVKGYGEFEGYANRDSLKYLETYQLSNVSTFLRGTLRRPGFASAWNVLIHLGLTNDLVELPRERAMTNREVLQWLVKDKASDPEEFCKRYGGPEDVEKIKWLGLFSEEILSDNYRTAAEFLQKILEKKWKLNTGDIDMIVMQHQFEYQIDGKRKKLTSSLVVKGDNEIHTAMAKTVGLPLGIAAKLILQKKIMLKGVQIPIYTQIYEPVLWELEQMGIRFVNEEYDV